MLIPPSPPTGVKTTRPNYRAGWTSVERVMSGSLRLSRASTRTSLASDDLEKYLPPTTAATLPTNASHTELNGILDNNPSKNHNTNNTEKSLISNSLIKPLPPPRLASSSTGNLNPSNQSRNLVTGRSYETPSVIYDTPNSLIPPPVKVKKKLRKFIFRKH